MRWLSPDVRNQLELLLEVTKQSPRARVAVADLKPMPVAAEMKKKAEAPEAVALDNKSMVQAAPKLSNGSL